MSLAEIRPRISAWIDRYWRKPVLLEPPPSPPPKADAEGPFPDNNPFRKEARK